MLPTEHSTDIMCNLLAGQRQMTIPFPLLVKEGIPYLILNADESCDLELQPEHIQKLPEGSVPPYKYLKQIVVRVAE